MTEMEERLYIIEHVNILLFHVAYFIIYHTLLIIKYFIKNKVNNNIK